MTLAQNHNMDMSSSDTSDSDDLRDSFTAVGEISSLIITVPEDGFDISTAFKVILTGDWNLNVEDGKVTNFAANFLASPIDGSRPHTHQIINLRPNSDDTIILLHGNNTSINGKADIKINGVNVWEDTDIEIQILNGSTITIDPEDTSTDGHFGDQSVNGIVTRLIS
jgi:DNA-binding winged helix-turn-helix (wHTH) protein